MRIRRSGAVSALFSALVLSLTACDQPAAIGEASSLIIIATEDRWAEVEADTRAVLEPTIFTTRDEKQYEVTAVDPGHARFADLQLFKQVLVFGTEDDPFLVEVAEEAGLVPTGLEPGRVFQANDVWARGQTVTAAVLRRDREVETWIDALPSVLNAVDQNYREYTLQRMYATPADTALSEDLARRFGFSLSVPEVYDRIVRGMGGGDSLVIVRNDNPDPSQLIRSVLITSRPSVGELTPELALEWRAEIDATHYNVAQEIDDSNSNVISFQWEGNSALEVTGVWKDETGGFPAAGPFIVWLVDCPTRTYFIDAWLYAPDQPKYQYILQLQEILGSFRCA